MTKFNSLRSLKKSILKIPTPQNETIRTFKILYNALGAMSLAVLYLLIIAYVIPKEISLSPHANWLILIATIAFGMFYSLFGKAHIERK